MNSLFIGMTQRDFIAMREMILAQSIQFAHEEALEMNAIFDKSIKGKMFFLRIFLKNLLRSFSPF